MRAQEAEFLLTQSWDRRPQHVAALLLPHQSAGGSGVLGWALEAPQLPLLCASPWFTKLCLDSVWTRHTLYGTTSARGETYMGEQKTAAGSFPFFVPSLSWQSIVAFNTETQNNSAVFFRREQDAGDPRLLRGR